MYVFTEEWIQQLEKRYRNHARYEKPAIYHYATDPDYGFLRKEIDTWVGSIPEPTRLELIPRLRSEAHFEHTHNELFVGHVLSQLGFTIEYEKPFVLSDRLFTPDWYAIQNGSEIVVEVFTVNPSHISRKEIKKLGYFYARISMISYSGIISIEHGESFSPDQKRSKEITALLETWLNEDRPQKDMELDLNEVTFKFLGESSREKLGWIGPTKVFVSNLQESLKTKVMAKVKKYKDLSLPLVIAVIPDSSTFLEIDDLKDALWGREGWLIDWDNAGQSKPFREANGLYTLPHSPDTVLSGILWIPKRLNEPLTMPQIGIFPNPNARVPIQEEYFKVKK